MNAVREVLLNRLLKRVPKCDLEVTYIPMAMEYRFCVHPENQRPYRFSISNNDLFRFTEPGRIIGLILETLNKQVLERRREIVAATNGQGYW